MAEHMNEGFESRVGLAVDVQSDFRPCFQKLSQCGDVLGVMNLDLLRFCEGDVADFDVNTAGSQQVFVVESQQDAVFRRVHVRFEVPITQSHSMGERRHRVFGMHSCAAAVGEGKWPWEVEIGMHEGAKWSGPVPSSTRL